ncbi:hypothetical protein [Faecalicatena contorta]|uniref:hypothetical protein n=1 Tax=Faecalicatena contorta TaxID=39482 RepID=UPI001F1B2DB8|nr:hypothetical protein [Faecalicatena contorta]MCF2554405.1 hypothetical protein [Faecalicatena contorta]
MEFKYTNTWEEFEEYCEELYRGYLFRYRKGWGKSWEYEMQRHYVAEMKFIRSKVNEKPDIIKQLWIAAFVGMLSKKYDLTINVKTQTCPYVLHLLNLLPYDVLDEGYALKKIYYSYTTISFVEYEVGELFYNTVKTEIDKFFSGTGYEFFWIAQRKTKQGAGKPIGIGVLPQNRKKLDYVHNCGRLCDGTLCFLEENNISYEATDQFDLTTYYYRVTELNSKLDTDTDKGICIKNTDRFMCSWDMMVKTGCMTPEEELRFRCFKPEEGFQMIQILASVMADIDRSELESEIHCYPNYFTREDIFEYLIEGNMSEENAGYWTTIIRKGQFDQKYNKNGFFSEDEVEKFRAVKFLPSKWNVLTRYKMYRRYAIQKKIIESEKKNEKYFAG